MFNSFLRDRRVWLLGSLAILVWVISRKTIPSADAIVLVVRGGYWVLLAIMGLLIAVGVRMVRKAHCDFRLSRQLGVAVVVILLGWSVWLSQEPKGFKILSDELLLTGPSMSLHFDRQVAYPVRATDVQGPFVLTQRVLDKRPFFFPLVISLVHDFTGYRTENGFYTNMALALVFLGLVYVLGAKVAGNSMAGVFLVLLFIGLPLMAVQATGAGFELLNLVMLAGVFLLGVLYAQQPDSDRAEALALAGVLLAYTRYESVVFLLPVAALLLWGWWRSGRIILTWPMMLTPVMLMPYLLQNRIFGSEKGDAWQLASRPGATEPFALHYVPGNLGHALAFFFDTSGFQPNSIFFGAVGLLALPFFVLWLKRVLSQGIHAEPIEAAVAWLSIGLWMIAGLLMVYFWGEFDHPVIRRLSLPVHLLMGIAAMVVGGRLLKYRTGWNWACGLAVVALMVQGLPWMARRAYAADYSPGVEMTWRTEFLERFPAKDYLFLDRDIVFWIIQRIPATAIQQARDRRDGLAFHLKNHSFSAMYAFQVYSVNADTGGLTVEPEDDLGPDFELETVVEKRIQTLRIGRISRITAIHQDHERRQNASAFLEVKAPGSDSAAATEKKDAPPYIETFIKQLP